MKVYISVLGLFLFNIVQVGVAQNSVIDSLENLLHTTPKNSASYLNHFYKWTEQLIKENNEKSAASVEKLITLTTEAKDSIVLAKAYILQGNLERNFGEWNKASIAYRKALEVSEKLDDKEGIAQSYFQIARMHHETTDLEKAFEYAELALRICEENKLETLFPHAYKLLGGLYFHKAASDSIPESSQLAYQKAETYYNKTIDLSKKIGDEELITFTLGNLIALKTNQGMYEQALQFGEQALMMNKKLQNTEALTVTHINIGYIYYVQENYDQAIPAFEKALQLSLEKSYPKYQSYAIGNLLKIFRDKGDFEEAFQYAWDYIINTEAVYNKQKTTAIAELEAQYEVDKKEQANKLLTKENELIKTRNMFMGFSTVGLLILLLALAYIFVKIRKQNRIIESQNTQLKSLNETQNRLMAIVGHDLRGPLFSLQGIEDQFTYLLETGQIQRLKELGGRMEKTTKYLSETLNNLLNWSMHNMGTFPYQPEKVYLKKTVENIFALFEGTANTKEINLKMNVPNSAVAYADKNAVSTILRNLLSNAIKFTDQKGQVLVSCHVDNGMLRLNVSDTGIGMSETQADKLFQGVNLERKRGTQGEKSTGLGLLLVKDLIEQNKGYISVKSKVGEGTTFEIRLPKA